MEFRVLPEALRDFAKDTVVKYFKDTYGYKNFKAEEQVNAEINFRPTLKAECREDGSIICIEIMERLRFNETLSSFILDCRNEIVPVKFYIVLLKSEDQDPEYKFNFSKAKKNSVAVYEIDTDGQSTNFLHPLSQSLAGLRVLDTSEFPVAYRASYQTAVDTFRQGNPSKGCQTIYEEIEKITRKIAIKANKSGCWKARAASPIKFETDSWYKVTTFLIDNLNFNHTKIKPLKSQILNEIAGITPYRNETGHKPKDLKELKKRDIKLKSRFEVAADLLLSLINSCKNLKP